MFEDSGCKQCRNALAGQRAGKLEDVLQQIGKDNLERQARLYRCLICGAYWEDPNGAYPYGLSESQAKKFYNA